MARTTWYVHSTKAYFPNPGTPKSIVDVDDTIVIDDLGAYGTAVFQDRTLTGPNTITCNLWQVGNEWHGSQAFGGYTYHFVAIIDLVRGTITGTLIRKQAAQDSGGQWGGGLAPRVAAPARRTGKSAGKKASAKKASKKASPTRASAKRSSTTTPAKSAKTDRRSTGGSKAGPRRKG